MNYLKEIKNVKNLATFAATEREVQIAQDSAYRLIKFLAEKMYHEEYNRAKYELWDAIRNITESIHAQGD